LSSPNDVVPTDLLAEDVWDGAPPSAAASTLQSHVSALRQLLGPDRLFFEAGGYRVRVESEELDTALFESDIVRGREAIAGADLRAGLKALEVGLDRWRGFPFADAGGASWTLVPATRLSEQRNAAIEDALDLRLEMGLHREVCILAEEAVEAEPYRERRWAALMLALYRAGRQAEALQCYQRARRQLDDELGIEPSPQLTRLENDILLQSEHLDWRGDDRAPVTAGVDGARAAETVSRTNLPAPVSEFVGRRRELAALDELMGTYRLVSIVGAPGIGKTRLAIEAAGSRVEMLRDGVWFVDLASHSEPDAALGAVARAIGVVPEPDEVLEAVLIERARSMQALLVLDNCEHLVAAIAAIVEQLLEAGRGLRVLATSREPLHVPGEVVWQTPPIATPEDSVDLDARTLADFDGVQLFMERIGEPSSTKTLDLGELRLIGEVVAKLDGLPLAIELAAARAHTLGLRALCERLEDRLGTLVVGSRTARSRHQTLLATIDWSYRLLPADLQGLLRRLSVFVGGFTIEAAEAIALVDGHVGDMVALLTDRSLLIAEAGTVGLSSVPGPPRYRMLEIIRQFADVRLREEDGPKGEADARDAHSRYFRELASRASGALVGWHQGRWLALLDFDHANFIAAITRQLESPERAVDAMRTIVQLDRFWHNRTHLVECSALLQSCFALAGDALDTDLRCEALFLAGFAAIGGDSATASKCFSEVWQTARETRDDHHLAKALCGQSGLGYSIGDAESGAAAASEAVEVARRVGDPVLLGECLVALGLNAVDDLTLCRSVLEEAIKVTSLSGDRVWAAYAHTNLANGLIAHQHWAEAREHLESGLAIFDEIGCATPVPLVNLGWVCLNQSDPVRAVEYFTLGLRLSRRSAASYGAYCSLGLACTAVALKDWERAAALFGFADAELANCGHSWAEPERTYREQSLTELKVALGVRGDALYDSGRAADHDQMLDLALG
jgi:predicted ATPase/DNA-binding SARP family transcriptional activator